MDFTEGNNFIESRIQDSDDFDDDLYKQSKSVKNEELQQALLIGQITKKPWIMCIEGSQIRVRYLVLGSHIKVSHLV